MAATLALFMATAMPCRAGFIYGNAADADIRDDGTLASTTAVSLMCGGSGSSPNVYDRCPVFVFQLPDFGMVAEPFTSALFRFDLSSITNTPPNSDLYGLGRRDTSTVQAGDYYGETIAVDTTDATFLQDNILTSTSPVGPVSTDSAGGITLRDYLNSQYAGGAGIGKFVFLRLSSNSTATAANRHNLTSADAGSAGPPDTRPQIIYNQPTGYERPFIWVRDSEKAGILAKIAGNAWATSVYNAMTSRVAADVASHQSDRDAFLRQLPVEWTLSPAKFMTIPTYSESTVRGPTESKFNDALDCAVLYYLTGNTQYAECAADILHNAVKTLLAVAPSTDVGNGGWIFQDDFLKEARVTGTQLPIVYDFLHDWLQTHQVYDVQAAGMVNFNFADAQEVFRTLYELARDHGQKESNWSALMSTCMLNSLLALDGTDERNAALQLYLTTGSSRQASLAYDYRYYTNPGDIWPESLQYAADVGQVRTSHMVMLERIDPGLNLFDAYPNLPLSLPRISYMRYPNGQQIRFGDGGRSGTYGPFASYEMVYQHALARGRADLTSFFGQLINGGVADGVYNRSSLFSYSSLGQHNEPLQLLWQAPAIAEPGVTPELPRTDTLLHAGISLQRNLSPNGDPDHGLMCFVGGAGHIHSHASGMSMELFGLGQVLGAKSGASTYTTALHENYYRVFASNNTVIVNGGSRGQGGWEDIGINTVQNVAMEPQPFATAVSPDFSFTCSSFADDKGTLAEATQQRTMAIVRTSPTTGYYVDVFRSNSTVTNRTATTLNGNVTNQYHDYIYRNVGETTVDILADGAPLPLFSQANRFQNDIGDAYDQPGWRYFTNTVVSYPATQSVKAQFVANLSGTPHCMDMHMPAVASREVAKVDCPPIVGAPSPYGTMDAAALVIRQIGEAWNKAFVAVYEPHFDSNAGTVQNVTQLLRGGVVVGAKVESTVLGKNLVHYIISNPGASETYTDTYSGLTFTGRFGIASDNGDGSTTLYLGEGSSLSYLGNSVATVSGANSQAEVRFVPGQPPAVTANTPVTAGFTPPPAVGNWVPAIGGAGFDWTDTANWNPAAIPNKIGDIALMNIDITGDQTVNINSPVKLGELVVGDSSGGENTILQKGASGSIEFDQPGTSMAYITRTAGGTGEVNFAEDLGITLNDSLTVRLAGGSMSSTMTIAGVLSGVGSGLTKEGDGLTLVLSGNNTYSGTTFVNGGVLALAGSGTLGNGSGLVLNGGRFDLGGLSATVAALSVMTVSGDGDTISNGSITATSYAASNTGGNAIVSANLLASGSAGFSKTGAGVTTLSGTNTYSGATTVAGGVLRLQSVGALPGSNVSLVGGGILGLGAANLVTRALGTGINQLRWTGDGGFAAYGAQRAVKFSDSSINWNVTNFIPGGRTLILGHDTADATLDWQQRISLAGSPRVIQVNNGPAGIDAEMSGIVAGGSSGTSNVFTKTGVGTLAFTAQNTYWGDTIVSAGTLMIGDGGNTGGVSQNSPNIFVDSGATLAVNRGDTITQGTDPLKVAISGNGGFTQAGAGNTVLMLANTYAGPTAIDHGTLTLGADEVLPDATAISIGDAKLDTGTFTETVGTLDLTGAAVINLDAGATITFTDSSGIDWTGGTLSITGNFVSGSSLSFGANSGGLTPAQLALISAPGFTGFGLDQSGHLTANAVIGYAAWSVANAPNTGSDPNADEDGDGVANGVEYVLGGLIGINDLAKLPVVSCTAGNMIFSFVRDQASIDGVATLHIELGDDLVDWPGTYSVPDGAAANNPGVTVVKNTPPGFDTVTLSLSLSGPKKFARLKVKP